MTRIVADDRQRTFALEQLLSTLGQMAGELESRAARLREFRGKVADEFAENGIEPFKDSTFLTNVTREATDAMRQNLHRDVQMVVQFASTVQFGRP